MGRAVSLRDDYDASALRRLACASKDAKQTRRLLALVEVYDGGSRSQAARHGGVGLQVIRDWVLRLNRSGPDGLIDGKAPGKPRLLNDAQRAALVRTVEAGPIPAVDGVVRWRLIDLAQWLWDEYGLAVSRQTLGRELKALGYAKLSARPRHHAQDADAGPTFKKNLPRPVE